MYVCIYIYIYIYIYILCSISYFDLNHIIPLLVLPSRFFVFDIIFFVLFPFLNNNIFLSLSLSFLLSSHCHVFSLPFSLFLSRVLFLSCILLFSSYVFFVSAFFSSLVYCFCLLFFSFLSSCSLSSHRFCFLDYLFFIFSLRRFFSLVCLFVFLFIFLFLSR